MSECGRIHADDVRDGWKIASHDSAVDAMKMAQERSRYLRIILGEAIRQLGGELRVGERILAAHEVPLLECRRDDAARQNVYTIKEGESDG
jgi:hypothetical protein